MEEKQAVAKLRGMQPHRQKRGAGVEKLRKKYPGGR